MIGDDNFAKAFLGPEDPRPSFTNIWQYNETGNRYRVTDSCKMKIESGEWVEGIIYMCLKTALIFTRDKATFMTEFTKVDT